MKELPLDRPADSPDVATVDRLRQVQANLREAFPDSLVGQRRALERAEEEIREVVEAADSILIGLADGGELRESFDPDRPVSIPWQQIQQLRQAMENIEGEEK